MSPTAADATALPHTAGDASPRPVVLYARGDTPIQSRAKLEALRAYARAERLEVADVLGDVCRGEQPMVLRPRWSRVVDAIESGDVAGLVCQREDDITRHPAEKSVLRAWLQQRGAFAVYPDDLAGGGTR